MIVTYGYQHLSDVFYFLELLEQGVMLSKGFTIDNIIAELLDRKEHIIN